ncbi:MAG: hypothetical protein DDG60_05095 [Anaerolineae bacterium]|nr:MAG: hypothetical protein DDG60_05095 [Anaerolineae bacterium]
MAEKQQPIPALPLDENEEALRKKFYEHITAQGDLMDKLAERLLTLELGIPGLFATILKLIRGDGATLTVNLALYLTFGFWLLALALTLAALIPKAWTVDVGVLKQDPKKFAEGLGIQDYFEQSARHKRRLLMASSLLFFAGIFSAIFTLG